MDQLTQRYLSLLPDLPRWVETRDLVSRDGSILAENVSRDGFVVWSEDDGMGSVVGEPDPVAVARAAGGVSQLLAFPDNFERVRHFAHGFQAESTSVFSAPEQLPPLRVHSCRQIGHNDIVSLEHLPSDLIAELSAVAEDGVTVMAAFDGTLPVAFSYVASETEALWDVSVDTVESHRRRGYAAAAVVHLMRLMKEKGKSAVWGAVESNQASANLARRLGFVEVDKLWVFTRGAP